MEFNIDSFKKAIKKCKITKWHDIFKRVVKAYLEIENQKTAIPENMQMIIHSVADLQALQGKFVLQINKKEPDQTLMGMDWLYAKGDRLKIVTGIGLTDLYGMRLDCRTFEEFQNMFNHCLFDHMIEKSKIDGGRFHRLLTARELQYLFEKIKEENY